VDLQVIRKYLDQLDTILRYILLQRMSLIPLVAEAKLENGIPMFQPKREEEIFIALQEFSLNSGLNPELLTNIYKIIINDAHRIENNIMNGNIFDNTCYFQDNLSTVLDNINDNLKEYIDLINIIRSECSSQNNSREEFINIFTTYYKERIIKGEK